VRDVRTFFGDVGILFGNAGTLFGDRRIELGWLER
jgi:hypothetical protein